LKDLNEHYSNLLAQIAHETNRAYCISLGDETQVEWSKAPDWQRESAVNGVMGVLLEGRTPEENHEAWMTEKLKAGWTYGEKKDPDAKTHPCLLPYSALSDDQKLKDALFVEVVEGCAVLLGLAK
jgi:hypothetical protein